ncbi:MAG: glycosyltransferase family 1 protein [bacterium]|nr:glycosyltransferase family 1 protein [bacterium]
MTIGIDASRAFLKRRTGIEESAYQTIKHLRSVIPETDTVVLYVRKKLVISSVIPAQAGIQSGGFRIPLWIPGQARDDKKKKFLFFVVPEIDFELPKNWRVRGIWAPRFWTQIGLSLEMLFNSPDVLFIPAHTAPLIHPKKTIVTIHGLEYEFCQDGYSFLERLYMRLSIRFSCWVAEMVICVSENTKRDVMRLYGVPADKIVVIPEGYDRIKNQESRIKNECRSPYLLFIGRLEERKNVVRITEAFEILKKKYAVSHKLVLVGKSGYGYKRIVTSILNSQFSIHIKELGYVTEEEKWELLKNADVFLFPTLYEGFGIPVLEAQSVGVPVVASNNSSLPEVAGEGAIYVNPQSAESIAEGIYRVLEDKGLRDGIIKKGLQNVERFSWQKCAKEIGEILRK